MGVAISKSSANSNQIYASSEYIQRIYLLFEGEYIFIECD